MKDQIINAVDSPRELETLFRTNPMEFTRAFPDAFAERGDSVILQAWNERLFFKEPDEKSPTTFSRWQFRDILIAIVLSVIAGTLVKLPHFWPVVDSKAYYWRNIGGICVGSLIVYFVIQRSCRLRVAGIVIPLWLGALLYLNLLPAEHGSQTFFLSCLHMPFFFWSLLGIAYQSGDWKHLAGRMDYVRYSGEMLIYSTIIIIGGMVLTGLTFALFRLIRIDIMDWYIRNAVLYGLVAAPIVATFLIDRVAGDRFRIAPLLAKVFTPLFLLTVIVYLVAVIWSQKTPFTDRNSLMAFNGLLLVVLGLCVFSISERERKERAGISDFMNIGLTSVTLVIDVIALAAILFRLTSYGFTPNRVAVLGANLLAFVHLLGILLCYVDFVRRRTTTQYLEGWIVGYLPAYTTWILIVAVGLPLAFWFR